MSLWFHLTAARSILRRRRRAVARMTLTSFAATLWCLIGGLWALASWRETQAMAADVVLELFVPHSAEAQVVADVVRTVRAMPAVASVEVLDGSAMLRMFGQDLGGVDTSLADVVQAPSLVRCSMQPAWVTGDRMASIASACTKAFPMLEGAHWSKPYVHSIERRRADILVMGLVAGLLSAAMFMLAILYAFRAELHEAGRDLQVGVLLGATSSFIAMPHILVSVAAGGVGLALAGGALAAAWQPLTQQAPWLRAVDPTELAAVAAMLGVTGVLLCWGQSVSTVSRRTRLRRKS